MEFTEREKVIYGYAQGELTTEQYQKSMRILNAEKVNPIPQKLEGWNYLGNYGTTEIWGKGKDRVLVDVDTKQITFRYTI